MDTTGLTDTQLLERIAYFSTMLTQERSERIRTILSKRTRYLTVVLEDIFQPHNASAVLRSCDGFGVQDVHIIENANRFQLQKSIELGTSQWLSIHRYNSREQDNTTATVRHLKEQGYRIIATSPHARDVNLEELDVHAGKMALMFGTELTGLSDTALGLADEYMKIPMYGFVESFNISVSCAITLHHLSHSIRQSGLPIDLTEREHLSLLYAWVRGSIKHPELHDARFSS